MAKQTQGSEGGSYYTVFRNLSRTRRPFGYLGRYGREITGGGTFVFRGLIEDQPDFNERKRKAFVRDAQEGRTMVSLLPAEFAHAKSLPGYPTDRLGQSC